MNEVYLLTGGNIGNRLEFLSKALSAIINNCGPLIKASAIYETEAWGQEDQSPFLNQVLKIKTDLDPQQLLTSILDIEEKLGRKREKKYGPRMIDIDILFFNNQVISEEGLLIPHPHMQQRRFVLVPLHEIDPFMVHPFNKKTVSQMLAECTDPLAVNKFT